MWILEHFYQQLKYPDVNSVCDISVPSGTPIWNKSATLTGKCPFFDHPFYMLPLAKILHRRWGWPLILNKILLLWMLITSAFSYVCLMAILQKIVPVNLRICEQRLTIESELTTPL